MIRSMGNGCRSVVVIGIVIALNACERETEVISDWDHSASSLSNAALSSDGQYAVVSSFTDGASFWNLETNSRLYEWRHDESLAGRATRGNRRK